MALAFFHAFCIPAIAESNRLIVCVEAECHSIVLFQLFQFFPDHLLMCACDDSNKCLT
jgi:hypothetical protein